MLEEDCDLDSPSLILTTFSWVAGKREEPSQRNKMKLGRPLKYQVEDKDSFR